MRCDVVLQQKRAAEKCVCVWCEFQDVFSTTWPHGLISKRGVLGMGASVWGLSLPSQVTAQVQHVEWKQKLSWLSHCLQLALPLSLSLLPILLYLSVALLHSLCLLDLPVSTHTTGCGQRGAVKRETQWWWQRRRWGTNGPLLFLHVYGVHTTHTRRHTTAGTGNILDTVFKFN